MPEKQKTLAETGEYEFIRYIRNIAENGQGSSVVQSIGDDCLAAESFGNDLTIATIDTFVENVHFDTRYSSHFDIGKRCIAASVSDIAAMSGIPAYSLVSLSLPPQMLFDDAVNLFSGLSETATIYSCPISGGETTSTGGPATVTVTVIGRVEPDKMVLRKTALINDWIYVTGFLGDAMGGLMAFEKGDPDYTKLKEKFLTPKAQIKLSRQLTCDYSLNAMIDLSDGLATDIANICRESDCGALIYKDFMPLSEDLKNLSGKYSFDPVTFAISSGEDFGLLFTSSDELIPEKFMLEGSQITRIGKITDKSQGIKLIHSDGNIETITIRGYEHFKS